MTKTHKGRNTIKKSRTYKYEMRGFLIIQPLIEDPSMPPLLESDSDDESLEQDETASIKQILNLIHTSRQLSMEQLAMAANSKNDNISNESCGKFWCDNCQEYHNP